MEPWMALELRSLALHPDQFPRLERVPQDCQERWGEQPHVDSVRPSALAWTRQMSRETRDYRRGNADEDEDDPRAEMLQRTIEHASGPVVPALHHPLRRSA